MKLGKFYKQHKIMTFFPKTLPQHQPYDLEDTKVFLTPEQVLEALKDSYQDEAKTAYKFLLDEGRVEAKFSVIFYEQGEV